MTDDQANENREQPLDQLRNLGPKSVELLQAAGIETIEQLEDLGPVVAYAAVRTIAPQATLNLLWALAAGLQGRDWRSLVASEKESIVEELKKLLR
ncbi:MAG: TfoX/Sxy family DNA transformation protein [Planctomycetota bacterium]